MNYFKLSLCTLITFASAGFAAEAPPRAPLQLQDQRNTIGSALNTIQEQLRCNGPQVVNSVFAMKHCTQRAELLNAYLQASDDKTLVNTCDISGNSLLMQEIAGDCDPSVAQALLKHDADPCIQNSNKENALHLLLDAKKFETSDWSPELIRTKAYRTLVLLLAHSKRTQFMNARNNQGLTPLLRALFHSCSPLVVEELINAGADMYSKTSDGSSVIHLVASRYKMGPRKQLIDRFVAKDDANIAKDSQRTNRVRLINQPTLTGQTPLMCTAPADHRDYFSDELVDELLAHRPQIHAQDAMGETVLHKLLKGCQNPQGINNRERILDQLLTHDAQRTLANIADLQGNTPLMYSIKSIFTKKIIDHGADVTVRNNNGDTFINYLIKFAAQQWKPAFEELDATIRAIPENQRKQVLDQPDNEGNAPVINAIVTRGCYYPKMITRYGHTYEIYALPLEDLLKNGANPNARNRLGQSALELIYQGNGRYNWRDFTKYFESVLWKYNPENKWTIYKKHQLLNDIREDFYRHPILYTLNVVGITTLSYLVYKLRSRSSSQDAAPVNE